MNVSNELLRRITEGDRTPLSPAEFVNRFVAAIQMRSDIRVLPRAFGASVCCADCFDLLGRAASGRAFSGNLRDVDISYWRADGLIA